MERPDLFMEVMNSDDPPVVDRTTCAAIFEGRYTCPTLMDLLDFAAGHDPDPESGWSRSAIQEHLPRCPQCQKIYPELQQIAQDEVNPSHREPATR